MSSEEKESVKTRAAQAEPRRKRRPSKREEMRWEKRKIERKSKRRLSLIMISMNLSCLLMIGCIYILNKTDEPAVVAVISLVLAADLILLGFLATVIARYYREGRQAQKKIAERQRAAQAKRLLKRHAAKLSKETQAQLLGTSEGADGEAAVDMFFKLQAGELSSALQFLCMSNRQGLLDLDFNGDDKGLMYLDNGTVIQAEFQGITGLDAMALMVSAGEADAKFIADKKADSSSLEMPISQLLLEATVRGDELRSAGLQ